jgi:hypothetical protein
VSTGEQPDPTDHESVDDVVFEPDEVDKLIYQHRKIAEASAEANYRVLDNHLLSSDRVIANAAALKLQNRHPLRDAKELLDANPT